MQDINERVDGTPGADDPKGVNQPLPIETNQSFLIALLETIPLLALHPIRSAKRPPGDNLTNLIGFHSVMIFSFAAAAGYSMSRGESFLQNMMVGLILVSCYNIVFFAVYYLGVSASSRRFVSKISAYRVVAISSFYLITTLTLFVNLVTIILYCIFFTVRTKKVFSFSALWSLLLLFIVHKLSTLMLAYLIFNVF